MDSYIKNLRSWVFVLVIALLFSLFICFCYTAYCFSEIETLKEYHSNVCSECGHLK